MIRLVLHTGSEGRLDLAHGKIFELDDGSLGADLAAGLPACHFDGLRQKQNSTAGGVCAQTGQRAPE